MNGRGIGELNSELIDIKPWPDHSHCSSVCTASISPTVSQRPSVSIRLPGDYTQTQFIAVTEY